jgi:MFS family permease
VDTKECNQSISLLTYRHIQAVTAYSPVLLKQAGYSNIKQDGLAGGINTIGIIGTIISAQIIDRFGRRVCLMGGAGVLSAVNFIVRLSSFGNCISAPLILY